MFLRTAVGIALGSLLAFGAWAQDKPLCVQQERMKSCNAQAGKKELKGDERKAFMSRCLKSDKTANSQQERMKACNVQASGKELRGDARERFMRECLSGDPAVGGTARGADGKNRQ